MVALDSSFYYDLFGSVISLSAILKIVFLKFVLFKIVLAFGKSC
jgi:hypothetical protein